MNFNQLLSKMKELDRPVSENLGVKDTQTGQQWTLDGGPQTPVNPDDMPMPECGMDMMPPAPQKQQDNVTMNVSMNGSGAGGIRDLMSILKNIEQGADHSTKGHDATGVLVGDSYDNSPSQVTLDIDSVIPTGNDLASKGGEAEKVNGGGNPMGVDESLVRHLTNLYQEIKEGKKEKEPEGLHSSKRFETDGQRVARLAKEKRQAEKKERMKNDFNAEMER